MPFRVIERFAKPKAPDTEMEDAIAVTSDFCAVFDGATSKANQSAIAGHTTGRQAVEILLKAICNLPPESSVSQCSNFLTASINDFYRQNALCEVVRNQPERKLTASAVIYSVRKNEVWFFGDCQCRINNQTYKNSKNIDTVLASIRCDILNYLIRHGHQTETLRLNDMGRKFILNALRDQCAFQNASPDNPYAFPVIDGTPIRLKQIRSIKIPPHSHLILASDGYPLLCNTLAETESALRQTILNDPLCLSLNPQTKGVAIGAYSFDDRSFLHIYT
jgi:hypothetical protein